MMMLLLCFIKQAGFSVLSMMMSRNKKTPLLLPARTTSFFFTFGCFPLSLTASPVSNRTVKKSLRRSPNFTLLCPRFFVTYTRPFQIPNSTALVTTLPATAKKTRSSRRESRERETERARAREREKRERGKKTLKGKRKVDNDGRYVCFELSSNNNTKKKASRNKRRNVRCLHAKVVGIQEIFTRKNNARK